MSGDYQPGGRMAEVTESGAMVFADTCSLLHESWSDIEGGLFDGLRVSGKKLYILDAVWAELREKTRQAAPDDDPWLPSRARAVLESLQAWQDRGRVEVWNAGSGTFADRVFFTLFSDLRDRSDLILISQDVRLTHDLLKLNDLASQSENAHTVTVYRITGHGTLGINDGDIDALGAARSGAGSAYSGSHRAGSGGGDAAIGCLVPFIGFIVLALVIYGASQLSQHFYGFGLLGHFFGSNPGKPRPVSIHAPEFKEGDRGRYWSARMTLSEKCTGGDTRSCFELSRLFLEGYGDPERAAGALINSCSELKDGEACFRRWLLVSQYEDPDTEKSLPLVSQSCEYGYAPGCREKGKYFHRNYFKWDWIDPEEQPYSEAKESFDRACRGGDKPGCRLLAQLEANEKKRLGLARRCNRDSERSRKNCRILADLYLRTYKQPEKSMQMSDWAREYLFDTSAAEEYIDGRNPLARACNIDRDAKACLDLGNYITSKIDDSNEAGKAFWRACRLGSDRGCEALKALQGRNLLNMQEPWKTAKLPTGGWDINIPENRNTLV